jgi:hypothetical protein
VRIVARVVGGVVGVLWLVTTASLLFDETISSPPRALAGAVVLALVSAGCAFSVFARRRGARGLRSTALAAATVGFILSAPVPLEWNDGCNDHIGTAYAVAAPYLLVARPADTRVVLGGSQTLMACLPAANAGS